MRPLHLAIVAKQNFYSKHSSPLNRATAIRIPFMPGGGLARPFDLDELVK